MDDNSPCPQGRLWNRQSMTSFAPTDVNYSFLITKRKLYLNSHSAKRKETRRGPSPPREPVPSTSTQQGVALLAVADGLGPWTMKGPVEMSESYYLCPSAGSWTGPRVCPTNCALSVVLGTEKSNNLWPSSHAGRRGRWSSWGMLLQQSFRRFHSRDKRISVQWSDGL